MPKVKYNYLLILPIIFSSMDSFAQKDSTKLAYVAPSIGLYLINEPSFKDAYNSNLLAKASLALAVPITRSFFLKGSFSHMRKNGTPVTYTYDSAFNIINSKKEGSARFALNLINVGGELKIPVDSHLTFRAEGGASVFKGKEQHRHPNGDSKFSSDFAGFLGLYVGIGVDYRLPGWTIFINPVYIHSRDDIAMNVGLNYSGFSLQSGLKFFF